LSECWDSIKHLIQERKKVAGEQRALFKQHKDAIHQEIELLKKEFEAGTMAPKVVEEKLEGISSRMRNTQLGKIEIRQLRDELHALHEAVYEKMRAGQNQDRNSVKDRDAKMKGRFEEIRQKIQDLYGRIGALSHDEMSKELVALTKQLVSLPVAEADKLQLEKEIHNIRDLVQEKRAQAVLALSTDDQAKLGELKAMLEEEKKARQELKMRLESHRRMKGSSSLDFREALQYNDTIKEEKERLEKIDRTIEELEDQIAEIEG
jgi:chromosome segregation ATPase